jgi:hypothetical protein
MFPNMFYEYGLALAAENRNVMMITDSPASKLWMGEVPNVNMGVSMGQQVRFIGKNVDKFVAPKRFQ